MLALFITLCGQVPTQPAAQFHSLELPFKCCLKNWLFVEKKNAVKLVLLACTVL